MPLFFMDSSRWFRRPLCCRYLAVRFDRLRLPMVRGGLVADADWHWAVGFITDGQFEVLGAWRNESVETPQRVAQDLRDRGIERIKALAGDAPLVAAIEGFRSKACRQSMTELAESGVFGPRMLRAIRWTDAAAQRVQCRVQRAARSCGPLADDDAAADFIAQAFQRADRDLLHDRLDRRGLAPYGQGAFVDSLARAA
ncbi:transposase [Roseateles cellulosilyticus]|uniref:Transposase n=1 Tax=Pelomonas cellulosilytica TaxID=2906762 RepID=A0ABS8XUN6_9BURK|nr:transposase [Pelomonas sp. P8]MCE4555457.1 transposase [Pelomonas sp. P8]